jgi:hypothetical protein
MSIEITNPRHVAVTLSYTRKGGAYQVDKGLRWFLENRGWMLQKLGSSYARMMPPDGVRPPFVFNVDIPAKDQIMALAQEKHEVGKLWVDRLGEWPAWYVPPHSYSMGAPIDPFTGQTISEPAPGGVIHGRFQVGFLLFWDAAVSFEDGAAKYFESKSQPLQPEATDFTSPDELPSTIPLIEGASCRIVVNAYERNPEARRKCIEAHGTLCCICEFNFGAKYGAEAEGYIHVHHIRPLSEIGGEYVVDPVADLLPVCPNCHAMLHLGGKCRTIEEVRRLLQRQERRA